MAGSSNFVQWNPSTSPNAGNQQNDTAYATSAGNGAAVNAIFPSNVANKLFYQLSTFVYAFTQALAAQGFNLSDANPTPLQAVFANIVLSGVAASPTLGNVTANNLLVASLTSTTGILCNGGIQSGSTGVTPGDYAVVDTSLALHNGYTGPVAGRNSGGGIIV
jgi:hypothetical protein